MSNLTVVLESKDTLGEAPFWDQERGLLYWLDIKGHRWHTYNPATDKHHEQHLPIMATNVIPLAEDDTYFLATTPDAFAVITADAQVISHNPVSEINVVKSRFNDGACDAHGRFWVGTMGRNAKSRDNYLFRLDQYTGSYSQHLDGVGVSNGIAWSPDNTLMYYNDSPTGQTDVFNYDLETGTISNRRKFATPQSKNHHPDGLTTDSEGHVWVAMWDGGRVVRYAPDGNIERVIEVPASRTTSVTFGGADLTTLYITTARDGLSDQQLADQPLAGSLFALKTHIKGLPQHRFRK